VAPPPAAPSDSHEHEHEAPHKGILVELGDEFAHIELVLDRSAGMLTAFALDGEAERPVRLPQPVMRVRLAAPDAPMLELNGRGNALTGETPGNTSEFVATAAALRTTATLTGTILEVTVRGTTFKDVAFVLTP
jgi:hypothetical protein